MFAEYETLSVHELGSAEFREKYAKLLLDNNKVVPTGSDIIKKLAEKLGKTVKATYLIVGRKFLKRSNPRINVNTEETLDLSDNTGNTEEDKHSEDLNDIASINGEFDLKDEVLFETETRRQMHRDKMIEKLVVKEGWTSKLATFLYQNTNLSCKYEFKHIWILKSGVIETKGNCACKSLCEIKCNKNILSMNISNIDKTYKHTHKYQMRGTMKNDFATQVKDSNALVVRNKFINKICPSNSKLEENFIPVLPSLNAIRLIKHKSNKRDESPVDVILDWKNSKYKNIISSVGHSPFYVFYRTTLQLAWYTTEAKKSKRITISIDSTGTIVMPPAKSQHMEGTNKLKHVFLYSVMAKKEGNKSLPISQMISQDHTSEFISLFLFRSFKNLKQPDEIVCDESKALLKAVATTFARSQNIADYINNCMNSLHHGAPPPECYIRVDRSHFIKNVCRKIKHRDSRKRYFFRCVIGFLIQCDNYENARKIIYDFFTLILSENDGYNKSGDEHPSEAARKRLTVLCATHNEYAEYAEELEITEENDDANDLVFDVNNTWIEDIIAKVPIKKSDEYHQNAYYCPQNKKMYMNIFSSIALWSNVMNNVFHSTNTVATSSDVESYFKSLKCGVLQKKMFRADDFLQAHIDFINAEIKVNAGTVSAESKTNIGRNRSNSLSNKPKVTNSKCSQLI